MDLKLNITVCGSERNHLKVESNAGYNFFSEGCYHGVEVIQRHPFVVFVESMASVLSPVFDYELHDTEEHRCNDNCHTWVRLKSKDDLRRKGKRFIHTTLNDDDVTFKAEYKQMDIDVDEDQKIEDETVNPQYVELIEKVVTDEVLDSMIAGTNQHGLFDAKYKAITAGIPGRMELKVFLCILIVKGMRKGKTEDL